MTTYRELVYLILDEIKGMSDDFSFTEDHILFLLDKYRVYILKQKYSDIRKQIPESNYQTIEFSLVESPGMPGTYYSDKFKYLKSYIKIPFIVPIGVPRVYVKTKNKEDIYTTYYYGKDYYRGEISYISRDRMRYVGYNKFLQNIVYCSIAPDNYIYFKSPKWVDSNINNTEEDDFSIFKNMTIKFTGIFQNSIDASNLSQENTSDILDRTFPLEEGLIPAIIDFIVKELTNSIYRPSDDTNNAKDDLGNKVQSNKEEK